MMFQSTACFPYFNYSLRITLRFGKFRKSIEVHLVVITEKEMLGEWFNQGEKDKTAEV